mmetsp:Transcript_214/g.701  ORF Transcript_214/g.701 Transcript_214/m.701 type:complete len:694 (+) Transcript_214:166-2247(+)
MGDNPFDSADGGTSWFAEVSAGAEAEAKKKKPAAQLRTYIKEKDSAGTSSSDTRSAASNNKTGSGRTGSSSRRRDPDGGREEPASQSCNNKSQPRSTSEDALVVHASADTTVFDYAGDAQQPKAVSRNQLKKERRQKAQNDEAHLRAARAELEQLVINCLFCGKIYDCRNRTDEIQRFMDSGGLCSFCGHHVNEDPSERDGSRATPADSDALAQAQEQKDRLVNYDRTAASRTTVIDDQSDYFEIESNAWLTSEEKAELKRRKALEEAQEEKLRKQIHVTFDLLGNKVIVADPLVNTNEGDDTMNRERPGALENARIAGQNLGLGLGPAAKQALATNLQSLASEEEDLHLGRCRVHVNPAIRGAAPMFVQATEKGQDTPEVTSGTTSNDARNPPGSKRQSSKLLRNSTILQDDEPSIEWLSMTQGPRKPSSKDSADGTFDIGSSSELGRRTIVRPLPSVRERKSYSVMADGFVVLRNFLDLADQKLIVGICRKLGVTPGLAGFTSPTYADGARLHLQMMCLGRYWDLNHHCYADKFGVKADDRPHAIPDEFKGLVERCLQRANEVIAIESKCKDSRSDPLPNMDPDVCLCNFYSHGGSLGMHQDKDESATTLKSGIPVVSFSVGDAADFHYSPNSPEDLSNKVLVASGDAIVFGGKSRLLYHGVTKVHNSTSPSDIAKVLRPGRLNLTFRQSR